MLYFMRHAETILNEEKRLRGWKDPDVLPASLEKAKQTGQWLKTHGGIDIGFCSDFKRTRETAKTVQNILKFPLHETTYLRPIDFGELNGHLLSEAEPKIKSIFETWINDPDAKAFGGDSFSSFQDRMVNIMKFLHEILLAKKNVLAVTHSRVCLYSVAYLYNLCRPLQKDRILLMRELDIGYTDLIRFSLDSGGNIILSGINLVHG